MIEKNNIVFELFLRYHKNIYVRLNIEDNTVKLIDDGRHGLDRWYYFGMGWDDFRESVLISFEDDGVEGVKYFLTNNSKKHIEHINVKRFKSDNSLLYVRK